MENISVSGTMRPQRLASSTDVSVLKVLRMRPGLRANLISWQWWPDCRLKPATFNWLHLQAKCHTLSCDGLSLISLTQLAWIYNASQFAPAFPRDFILSSQARERDALRWYQRGLKWPEDASDTGANSVSAVRPRINRWHCLAGWRQNLVLCTALLASLHNLSTQSPPIEQWASKPLEVQCSASHNP